MTNNKSIPLISIITITYNAVKTIEETILSVINQTYPNIEYIIIDGGSTDGTIDIIKKYESHISHWISEPDKGIYNAMNKGIELAHGKWINFMNSGDTFYDKKTLENIRFSKIKNENIKVIYGDTLLILKSGKAEYKKALQPQKMKRQIICCHQSLFISTENKEEIKFNEYYKLSSDYNTLYNIHKKYGNKAFLYYNFPISIYDASFGVSSTNILKTLKEQLIIRSQNKNIRWYFDSLKLLCKEYILKL